MSAVPVRVGVVGGGRMGSGIAHAFLVAGSTVTVVEADDAAAERARAAVLRSVRAGIERGAVDEDEQTVLGHFALAGSATELAECELVVEAVPEDARTKAEVLGAVAASVAPKTVIASNTSSMSIGELAAAVPGPERFLGLHFFNPVPASRLIEVVVGPDTGADVVQRAQGWVEGLGRTAVTVRDSPGFASSRLGLALGLEAIRMVQDGVADAADIDAAMTLGYGHPVGPLRLTDIVGLDVRLGIAEYLHAALGDRFAPPDLLRDMVSRGELGRKSGRGFYTWDR